MKLNKLSLLLLLIATCSWGQVKNTSSPLSLLSLKAKLLVFLTEPLYSLVTILINPMPIRPLMVFWQIL